MNTEAILFITGTDTGVGKTVVGATIAASLSARGFKINVYKPVESGCRRLHSGELEPPDAMLLRSASQTTQTLSEVVSYRLEAPLSPHLAARLQSVAIQRESILDHARRLSENADLLIVEGAGGVLVPLTSHYHFLDLARDLDASTLLVVRSRLGAINHCLLSIEALQTRGLPMLGYVLNEGRQAKELREKDSELPAAWRAEHSNRDSLKELAQAREVNEIGVLPHLECGVALLDPREHLNHPAVQEFSDRIIEYFFTNR